MSQKEIPKDLQDRIVEAELLQLNVDECPGALAPCGEIRPLIKVGPCRLDYDDSCIVCTLCAQHYTQYWDEMWSEYYRNVL